MATTRIRALALSLSLIGASAGLTAVAAAPAESAAATSPVIVSISSTRVVTMPTTIQPGITTFQVTSAAKRGSAFQLIMPAEGYTAEEASRDIHKGLEQGKVRALKRFEANVTLLGGLTADDTADTLVVDLDLGSYWALDTNQNNPAKFFDFTVEGLDSGNVMPESTTIKAKQATTWASAPKSIPHKGLLTLKNSASNNHFILIAKLAKGKTYKDFKDWIAAGDGPPPLNFGVGIDSGVVSPGHSATFSYKVPKGQYVLMCFWPDASMHGMPHAFMGMHRAITVK